MLVGIISCLSCLPSWYPTPGSLLFGGGMLSPACFSMETSSQHVVAARVSLLPHQLQKRKP